MISCCSCVLSLLKFSTTLFASLPWLSVISDSIYQVVRPSVMEEEDALSDAPEGSGSELIGAGPALRDAVGKALAHVVDEKVRVKIRRLIGKRGARDWSRSRSQSSRLS